MTIVDKEKTNELSGFSYQDQGMKIKGDEHVSVTHEGKIITMKFKDLFDSALQNDSVQRSVIGVQIVNKA